MIYNENKIYAKVWKVKPAENGKYIDLQITTSEKDGEGNWKNSSWFPRAIGHAVNQLKNLKENDRIVIAKSKFTNERYEDGEGNKKSMFRFLILEATVTNDSNEQSAQPETSQAPAKQESPAEQEAAPKNEEQADDDMPW